MSTVSPMPPEAFFDDGEPIDLVSHARRGALPVGRSMFPDKPVGGRREPSRSTPSVSMPEPPEPPDPRDVVGGSGSSSSSAQAAGVPANSGLDRIAAAQRKAAAAAAELDTLFEQRKEMLREQYQLEESPEEKANIQHLLDIIEVQREQGTKVIERVYGSAIEDAAARAEDTRELGEEAGERTAETFRDAAGDASELFGELNERFGGAMGAGGEPVSEVAEGTLGALLRQAETEGAFDRRMFDLTASDIDFLGEAMRPEMAAQVGALQRDAAQTSALSQFQHDQRVQDRVAQERMQHAAGLQQLSSQFDQRRFGLQDQQMSMDAMAAEIAAQNARHNASLRQQAASSVSPAQQMELERAEREFEGQMRQFEQDSQSAALRSMGVDPGHAQAATALGAAPGIGSQILQREMGFGGDDMQMLLEALGG